MSANKPPFDGEWLKLKGRVEYVRGVTYKAAVDLHEELDRGSYILLRANNIQDGRLSFDDVQYVDKSKVKPKQLLRKGDILICASSGSKSLVGKAARVENDMPITFGAFCCVLRPKTGESEYLGHYFQSRQYRKAIERVCSGSNINNLKAASFESLIVPLYSKTDMLSVVGVLDALVAQKRETESQLELLDTLVKSRFVEMFGNGQSCQIIRLGDYCTRITKGTTPTTAGFAFTDCGINYVKVESINNEGGFISEKLSHIGEECHNALKRSQLAEGDILFSIAGAIGRTAIVGKDLLPANTNQALSIIRLDKKAPFNRIFLRHALSSSAIAVITEKLQRGAAQVNLSLKDVANLQIPLPSISLQQEFASFVAEVDKSRFIVQQKIEKLQMLYDSLAQEYFG